MPSFNNKKITSPFSKTNQHDEKYKTIISAASELFNIHGTRGTTLAQIAQRLELTKTSLYYYVKTKQELVHQCYLNTCIEMQDMVNTAIESDGSALAKIELLLKLNFDCWNDISNGNRGHLAGLTEIASLSSKHQQEISEYYRWLVKQVIELINAGRLDNTIQEQVSAGKTANAIIGTLFWLPVWLESVDQDKRHDAFEQWVSVIKYGIKSSKTPFSFTWTDLQDDKLAPTGFDRKEQNRKKQEAFFKVGTMFFNQKGFKGTSLDELAQSLGVTKGAFYYHIKNKDDLLIKCFERTLMIEENVLQNALASESSGIDKLASAMQHLFAIQIGDQGPLIRYATMWSLSLDKRKEMQVATSAIRRLFGELISQGVNDNSIRGVDPFVTQNICAGAIESIPDMTASMKKYDAKTDASDYFHLIFNGIAS
ncbi:TetR/AcrR family transcriptional regulator [Thalassotalea sp. HSM 43]|uniref:TetR/AcrR family transcriptional regulator n=1 Tax=Thalassotalea sp. HSM 43 TaxID=2552945 RepID=UPI00107FEE1B|nr:TetR/AcrR family transcriptional regulator [Thalassotalea sp. HSM 43]QBY05863.1 TetR/AcrR family transcriptional regulator [Thalassotalea sp. HSM 43]